MRHSSMQLVACGMSPNEKRLVLLVPVGNSDARSVVLLRDRLLDMFDVVLDLAVAFQFAATFVHISE